MSEARQGEGIETCPSRVKRVIERKCRRAATPAHHLPEQIRTLCKRVRPLEPLWGEELALRDEENVSAVDVLTPHERGACTLL